MTLPKRAVTVKQLPEILNARHSSKFFDELESCVNVDRPLLVLDCAKVRQMDSSAVHLLLCCLEEAMKRNGDVKLASLPSGARSVLALSGIDRLFEVYDTNADAVKSFNMPAASQVAHTGPARSTHRVAESAGKAELGWSF
jgi:anti-sigma B factor antagonist